MKRNEILPPNQIVPHEVLAMATGSQTSDCAMVSGALKGELVMNWRLNAIFFSGILMTVSACYTGEISSGWNAAGLLESYILIASEHVHFKKGE